MTHHVSRNGPVGEIVSGDCAYTLIDLNTMLKELDRPGYLYSY